MDKNTFGDGRAAETLAKIIDAKYPKLSRKVSAHYHKFNEGLRDIFYFLIKTKRYGFVRQLLQIYRDDEFKRVADSKMPDELKSYLTNVQTKSFRFYMRVTSTMEKNENDYARKLAKNKAV